MVPAIYWTEASPKVLPSDSRYLEEFDLERGVEIR